MKKNFERPELEVTEFTVEDIVTTSNPECIEDWALPEI